MLRGELPSRSRGSVASQRQVPPKRKNEHAGGCIYGLFLRLPATGNRTGIGSCSASRGRISLGMTGRAIENPQTVWHAGSSNVVLVLVPTASSGGCGLFF